VRETETIFKSMQCPEEYKLGLATHLFSRETHHRCDSVKSRPEGEKVNPLPWEKLKDKLKDKLNDQYDPKDV